MVRYILPPMAAPEATPADFRALRRAGAVLCAVVALAGCAASPSVKAVKAERTASNLGASQVEVTLELLNPGEAPIELTEWVYSAQVNGKTVYTATWVAALTLPPNVPMTTALPIVVPSEDAAGLDGTSWSLSGSVGYRATRQVDRLLYQLGFNRLNAGFSVQGIQVVVAPPAPSAPSAPPTPPTSAPPAPAPPPGG